MPAVVRLPEVLTGMAEATLLSWHVAPGDQIAAGQPLAELETDKAVVDCESDQSGTVAAFLVEIGQPVTAGTPIAVLAGPGESWQQAAGEARGIHPAGGETSAAATGPAPEAGPPGPAPGGAPGSDRSPAPGRRFASPLVRRLAREQGVDLHWLEGTGPGGRIVRRDLARHLQATSTTRPAGPAKAEPARPAVPARIQAARPAGSTPGADFTDIPHTRMRRAIARRLTESQATVPHFYLSADCRADALLALRREVCEQSGIRVSLNDFVVKAVAGALAEVPEANAIWTPEAARRFRGCDIAVAVAVADGLVTPVVRGVEQRSLTDVSQAIAGLAARARAGSLRQGELEGGSFAVSNLGMHGIERFAAIISPPHAGILAVGAASRRAVAGPDEAITAASVMTVTLSADHRIMDGVLAARWMAAFRRRIEHPLTILV